MPINKCTISNFLRKLLVSSKLKVPGFYYFSKNMSQNKYYYALFLKFYIETMQVKKTCFTINEIKSNLKMNLRQLEKQKLNCTNIY